MLSHRSDFSLIFTTETEFLRKLPRNFFYLEKFSHYPYIKKRSKTKKKIFVRKVGKIKFIKIFKKELF